MRLPVNPVLNSGDRDWGTEMRSNTREALFGFIGLVIVGAVVWVLIGQARSSENAARPREETPAITPSTDQVPTRIVLETPASSPRPGSSGQTDSTPTPTPLATATPAPEFHVVGADETLSEIADRYGLLADAIAAKNNLEDPNQIYAGQRLKLPKPGETFAQPGRGKQDDRTYIVQEGDTLFAISQEFGVSVEALAEENDITDPSKLYVGRKLKIPEQKAPEP